MSKDSTKRQTEKSLEIQLETDNISRKADCSRRTGPSRITAQSHCSQPNLVLKRFKVPTTSANVRLEKPKVCLLKKKKRKCCSYVQNRSCCSRLSKSGLKQFDQSFKIKSDKSLLVRKSNSSVYQTFKCEVNVLLYNTSIISKMPFVIRFVFLKNILKLAKIEKVTPFTGSLTSYIDCTKKRRQFECA